MVLNRKDNQAMLNRLLRIVRTTRGNTIHSIGISWPLFKLWLSQYNAGEKSYMRKTLQKVADATGIDFLTLTSAEPMLTIGNSTMANLQDVIQSQVVIPQPAPIRRYQISLF